MRRWWPLAAVIAGLWLLSAPCRGPEAARRANPRLDGAAVTTARRIGLTPSSTDTAGPVDRRPTTNRAPDPTTSTSTTLAPVPEASTDRFERERPALASLPHSTPTWRIDWTGDPRAPELRVTLIVVANRADQAATIDEQLRRAKAAAMSWVATHDLAELPVQWNPARAAAL